MADTRSGNDPAEGPAAARRSRSQRVGLWLGPLLFLLMLLLDLDPGRPEVTRMAALALLMATWWITDAIPLFATALLPLFLFPLLGIERTGDTAPIYFNSTIVLFLGGFMIALTMEKWDVHRRIALWVIRSVGGGPARIVLGFMLAAAFLSMWISNTATAIMMLPVGLAVILRMEEQFGRDRTRTFSVSIMLGIAYACSAGGIATLVGTPPILSLQRIFQITFPDAPPIAFGQWFVMALPISALMLAIAWGLITRVFFRVPEEVTVDREVVESEMRKLGAIAFEERAILGVFAATAFLWVFRAPIAIGPLTVPGWSTLLPYGHLIDDGTVAITMASILFLIPTRTPGAKSRTVMGPGVVLRLPWNIVLLFGGGFALAHGFQTTGLARFIGDGFGGLATVPPLLLILVICLAMTFLTELTSNTATTEMVLPIFAAVAVSTGVHPLLLMIPATLSASCAFMMPVATPPNAVVFGSDRVRIAEMARVGLVLNLFGAVVITLIFRALGPLLFGIEPGVLPDWAGPGP
ncbi:SLC13 family permease [Candidatus Palauibacter sp.]|uniref:SLC13 family permease n=1 Tax=Candidatus Palauibacter sp. TaxID=3101350 RepID=UPI003AF2A3C1